MRLTLLIVVALVLAGCASQTEEPPTTGTTTTTSPATSTPVTSPTRSDPFATTPATTTPSSTPPVATTPTGPTPQLSGTRTIEIGEFLYAPADLVIDVGTEVRVQNDHVLAHTATSDTGVFDTSTISPGEEFRFYMNATGKYPYHCKFHPQMRGNITVIDVPEEQPAPEPEPEEDTTQQAATIFDFEFRPRSPTWENGTIVTWTNAGKRTHTVTANDGSFDSGNLPEGATFIHTFTKAGTYSIRCKIHPSMTDTITITA